MSDPPYLAGMTPEDHAGIAWRYARETITLLPACAPNLLAALAAARKALACVRGDGRHLIPIDRVAADRSFYSTLSASNLPR